MSEHDPTAPRLLQQQEVLAKFGELALRSDSLDEILTKACCLVGEALGTDLAKVLELLEDGQTLLVRAGVGWKEGVVGEVTVRAEKHSSEGFALQTGQPVFSNDIRTETRFKYADFIQDNGVEAIVNVVILGSGNEPPFGILQVDSRRPRHFGEEDTRFLRGYANLIGAAVGRFRATEKLHIAATHDSITSLPNRVLFRGKLEQALSRAGSSGNFISLLLIDLDHFKQINDIYGHQAGDAALCEFSVRLVEALPLETMVARLGGDEFAAVLPGLDASAAADHAFLVLDLLKPPLTFGGRSVHLRASIGISTFPAHGSVAPQLMANADFALYAAKRSGGNTVRAFEPALRAEQKREVSMLRRARTALENGWVLPFYQPQVALATGQVRGFEVLLRWSHPRAGMQYPATIACAFDDPGIAFRLGSVIADAALSDMKRWTTSSLEIGKLGINVSAAELRDCDYAERLLNRLDRHDLPPKLLEIEITETAFLDAGASSVLAGLEKLRSAGITVALDDFGTGFSSLSHLRDLPVVDGINVGSKNQSITEAVLMLGTALGLVTIAEGVETAEQAAFLKARGCTFAQGFLFSPAFDTAHATEYMKRPQAC
jgi:diguanylate cyclase (GGDEF)-like protein